MLAMLGRDQPVARAPENQRRLGHFANARGAGFGGQVLKRAGKEARLPARTDMSK
jgi:hypothetical protein